MDFIAIAAVARYRVEIASSAILAPDFPFLNITNLFKKISKFFFSFEYNLLKDIL